MSSDMDATVTPSKTTANRYNVRPKGEPADAGFVVNEGDLWLATSATSGELGSFATKEEAVAAVLEDDWPHSP